MLLSSFDILRKENITPQEEAKVKTVAKIASKQMKSPENLFRV